MEDNMVQVGSMLGNLKDMASTMGEEIDRQNRQIDKIGAKVWVKFKSLYCLTRFHVPF